MGALETWRTFVEGKMRGMAGAALRWVQVTCSTHRCPNHARLPVGHGKQMEHRQDQPASDYTIPPLPPLPLPLVLSAPWSPSPRLVQTSISTPVCVSACFLLPSPPSSASLLTNNISSVSDSIPNRAIYQSRSPCLTVNGPGRGAPTFVLFIS